MIGHISTQAWQESHEVGVPPILSSTASGQVYRTQVTPYLRLHYNLRKLSNEKGGTHMIRFRWLLVPIGILVWAVLPLHAQDDPGQITSSFDETTGKITLRNTNGDILHVLKGHITLYAELFSSSWNYYVSSDLFNFAYLWDTETGERLAELVMDDVNRVNAIAFSQDDELIAVGGERGMVIRVFAIDALRRGDAEPLIERMVVAGGAIGMSFNQDGTLLAATAYIDATTSDTLVLLWDLTTSELLIEKQLDVMVGSPQFNAKGTQLTVTGNGIDYSWDVSRRCADVNCACLPVYCRDRSAAPAATRRAS